MQVVRKDAYVLLKTLLEHLYDVVTLGVWCTKALCPPNQYSVVNFVLAGSGISEVHALERSMSRTSKGMRTAHAYVSKRRHRRHPDSL